MIELTRAVNSIQSSGFVSVKMRRRILGFAGVNIHKTAGVYCGTFFGSNKVEIGERVFINVNCFIDGSDWVRLGKHVNIGPNVQIVTSTHKVGPPDHRCGDLISGPVTIEEGCWIGASSIILPNVTVARGCVIAAGSVITKDTAANGLYAGVPAKRLKDLSES